MDSHILRQFESNSAPSPRSIGDEWALVQRAAAGDANAMELLFAPHMGRLYQVALVMLRNKEDAEDALQEGMCRAWRGLGSFQGHASFSTWLTRIVVNSALMAFRRRRSRGESSWDEFAEKWPEWLGHAAADKRPNPEQVYALVEFNALVQERMRKLTQSEQTALRHYAMNGHSMKESCQALGIGEGTFKSRVFRARHKLARALQRPPGKSHGSSTREELSHAA